jgi:hypothetical protein
MADVLQRRGFLCGIAATAAIGSGTIAMTLLPASADAELLGLGPKLEEIYAAFNAALHEHSVAQRAYFDRRRPRPVFDREAHINLRGEDQLKNSRRWSAALRAHEAEDRRLRDETRVDDLELASNHLSDDFTNALASVAELKATTIAGLKFKARWAEHDDEVTDSLIRDLIELEI